MSKTIYITNFITFKFIRRKCSLLKKILEPKVNISGMSGMPQKILSNNNLTDEKYHNMINDIVVPK